MTHFKHMCTAQPKHTGLTRHKLSQILKSHSSHPDTLCNSRSTTPHTDYDTCTPLQTCLHHIKHLTTHPSSAHTVTIPMMTSRIALITYSNQTARSLQNSNMTSNCISNTCPRQNALHHHLTYPEVGPHQRPIHPISMVISPHIFFICTIDAHHRKSCSRFSGDCTSC